jgi:hypothetical protein
VARMTRLLLGIAGPDSPAHAVPEGTAEALCGSPVEATISQDFPAGAGTLCRACLRAQAAAASSVPLARFGARKRAGGM